MYCGIDLAGLLGHSLNMETGHGAAEELVEKLAGLEQLPVVADLTCQYNPCLKHAPIYRSHSHLD